MSNAIRSLSQGSVQCKKDLSMATSLSCKSIQNSKFLSVTVLAGQDYLNGFAISLYCQGLGCPWHFYIRLWVVSWLVHSSPDQVVQVWALNWGHCAVLLCKTLLSQCLRVSTQVHKWVLTNLLLKLPCDGLASHPGGSRNTITLTYYRNREKHLPDGLLDLYADLTFTFDL